MGRAEWCVVTPILGGLDNRKEVGEGELVKVVSPLHGAGMWLAHLRDGSQRYGCGLQLLSGGRGLIHSLSAELEIECVL